MASAPFLGFSFRTKLIIGVLVLDIVVIAVMTALSLHNIDQIIEEQVTLRTEQARALLDAALVTPVIQRDTATIAKVMRQARTERGIEYLVLRDSLGQVLGAETPHRLGAHAHDGASANGSPDTVSASLPITLGNRRLGTLDFGISMASARRARDRMMAQVIKAAVFCTAASVALVIVLATWMTRDLSELTEASRRLASGILGARARIGSRDELGQLARSFNQMAVALEQRIRELRESAARLDLIMRGTAHGAWDWNLATGKTFHSPRFRELLGYDDAGAFQREFFFAEWLHPADRERVLTSLERHLNRREPFDEEFRLRRRDGSHRWFRGRGQALWDAQGNPYRLAGSISDITDRKLAQETLRQEKEFSDALIRGQPGIFYLYDQRGQMLRWNANFERVTGWSAAEIAGMKAYDFIAPEHARMAALSIQSALRSGGASGEVLLRTRDGAHLPYFCTLQRVQIEGGPLLLGVGVDISDRKRAEDEVRRLNDDLEQRVRARTAELIAANRELESFSYSVSHDLTAPLRSIDGFSRMLEEDSVLRLDAQAQRYVGRIRAGTQRMQQLIDDLLSLSRVTREQMAYAWVNLAELAEEIAAELEAADPGRNVELSIPAAIRVLGDPNLLRIVMNNLLSNAWKFTSRRERARIELGALESDGETVIFLKDDGAGFDMRYASKLFAPFQRMHGVKDFEGTGVGLAIVSRIVARHGGRIWAEAQVDRGATFYFTLGQRCAPVLRYALPAPAGEAQRTPPSATRSSTETRARTACRT
jgi:PAS domain S-box-containing protein